MYWPDELAVNGTCGTWGTGEADGAMGVDGAVGLAVSSQWRLFHEGDSAILEFGGLTRSGAVNSAPMHPASIGPFQILRELGRGGMGVVYLANDTKLDRRVAIKALPEDPAADPDRLTRFQPEAKILASRSHPNVGGIYGLESADGQPCLMPKCIEGETLADGLDRGAIPVDGALTRAR